MQFTQYEFELALEQLADYDGAGEMGTVMAAEMNSDRYIDALLRTRPWAEKRGVHWRQWAAAAMRCFE